MKTAVENVEPKPKEKYLIFDEVVVLNNESGHLLRMELSIRKDRKLIQ